MPGFDFASMIGGAVTGLGGAIGKVVDSINAPKEMKEQVMAQVNAALAQHQSEVLKINEQHEEAIMADTQNARNTNMEIQKADKASWLSKNLPPILAIFMTLIWGFCTTYILARILSLIVVDPKVDMTAVMAMYAGITGLYATILNFYFGSTHDSKVKDATITALS